MRRRTGLIEDLLRIAASLPWYVSLAFGAALGAFCHFFAIGAVVPPAAQANLGTFVVRQFGRSIAALLQYVLPLVFVFGAAASLLRRHRDAALLSAAAIDPAASVHALSWQEFERLIGAGFEQQGFRVSHTGGGGADGGVDLVLNKGRETTLVQCKQWRARKVGVSTVRELYGVMAAKGAAHGIVVSAGEFTPDARGFARGRNIDLVNGSALQEMLRGGTVVGTSESAAAAPSCPKCGARMIQRVARQGRNAGQAFWGCEAFPRCRAIAPLDEHHAASW
jgi:restriction system protein